MNILACWTWIIWLLLFYIEFWNSFWIYYLKHETFADNSPIQIYINKIVIKFEIKTKYMFKILAPETMISLRSFEQKHNKRQKW